MQTLACLKCQGVRAGSWSAMLSDNQSGNLSLINELGDPCLLAERYLLRPACDRTPNLVRFLDTCIVKKASSIISAQPIVSMPALISFVP